MKRPFLIICVIFVMLVPAISFADTAIAEFSWGPSISQPEGYRIFVREVNQEYDYQSPAAQVSGTTLTAQVTDLEVDKQYAAVCRAFAGNNMSVNSDEIIFAVPSKPITVNIPDKVTGISIKFIYE